MITLYNDYITVIRLLSLDPTVKETCLLKVHERSACVCVCVCVCLLLCERVKERAEREMEVCLQAENKWREGGEGQNEHHLGTYKCVCVYVCVCVWAYRGTPLDRKSVV